MRKWNNTEKGFMSIEAIGAIIVSMITLVVGAEIYNNWLDDMEYNVIAQQLSMVERGAKEYINDHYEKIKSALSSQSIAEISLDKLKPGNYLPPDFSKTNSYRQSYIIRVKKETRANSNNRLQAIIMTVGGSTLSELAVRKVSKIIGAHGGYFVEESGERFICGTLGAWREKASSFGIDPGNGHLVSSLFFMDGKSVSRDFLYRKSVPGRPELNQMKTTLNMGNQDLIDANNLSAKGTVESNTISAKKNIFAKEKIEGRNIHSKERLSTSEFLQVDGIVNEGTTCSGNLIGMAVNGKPLSCQSGVWRKLSNPHLHVMTIQGSEACGHFASSSVSCPDGYFLTGGGYVMTKWWRGYPVFDNSYPVDERTWRIVMPHGNVADICAAPRVNCIKINP
ncbi:MAG: shufflon system plasmid conjugative transfer pilus tip adhesin PilV (plasmid) [Candidatus Symbiodolus clandestinus]